MPETYMYGGILRIHQMLMTFTSAKVLLFRKLRKDFRYFFVGQSLVVSYLYVAPFADFRNWQRRCQAYHDGPCSPS